MEVTLLAKTDHVGLLLNPQYGTNEFLMKPLLIPIEIMPLKSALKGKNWSRFMGLDQDHLIII